MSSAPVEISVAGQAYRLRTDADPAKLRRLASIVDEQVRACDPNSKLSPAQALLYAALTLAEQLDDARAQSLSRETEARSSLQGILHRIDAALDATDPFFVAPSPRDPRTTARS
jgi:cell division protein ZapA (FtsZ GTPase activity inhibitor)